MTVHSPRRSSYRARARSMLIPLLILSVLSTLAFAAAAAEGDQDQGRVGDRNDPDGRGGSRPTVLATPTFLINTLPPPRILCSAVNLGTRPREVTVTLRINDPRFTPFTQTSTIGPDHFGGLDAGGSPGGRPVPPIRGFCEFESADVSMLRASVSVFDGLNQVPQHAPAVGEDGLDRIGRRGPAFVATPPFTVAPSQVAACLVVNLSSAPQAVTVTMRTDDGAPPRISNLTVGADIFGGSEVLVNATQPTQVSCEFESPNVGELRGSGTVMDLGGNRPVRQTVLAQ